VIVWHVGIGKSCLKVVSIPSILSGILTSSELLTGRRSTLQRYVIIDKPVWAVEMKIEANPTPEQLKWIILVILIAAGLGHEQILGLLA